MKRLPELMEELDVHCAVVSTMGLHRFAGAGRGGLQPRRGIKVAAAATCWRQAARVRQSGREPGNALPDPEAVGRVRNGCQNVDRTTQEIFALCVRQPAHQRG